MSRSGRKPGNVTVEFVQEVSRIDTLENKTSMCVESLLGAMERLTVTTCQNTEGERVGLICDKVGNLLIKVFTLKSPHLIFVIFFQYFVLTSKGELKSEDNCLDYNGYDLYLRECDGLQQNQKWVYKVRITRCKIPYITSRYIRQRKCGNYFTDLEHSNAPLNCYNNSISLVHGAVDVVFLHSTFLLLFQNSKLYHPRRDVCIDRGSQNAEHAKVRACDGRLAQVWEFSKTEDMD